MKRIKAYFISLIQSWITSTERKIAWYQHIQLKGYMDFGPVYQLTLSYQLREVSLAALTLRIAIFKALIYNHVN
jgi:hypothetical protein